MRLQFCQGCAAILAYQARCFVLLAMPRRERLPMQTPVQIHEWGWPAWLLVGHADNRHGSQQPGDEPGHVFLQRQYAQMMRPTIGNFPARGVPCQGTPLAGDFPVSSCLRIQAREFRPENSGVKVLAWELRPGNSGLRGSRGRPERAGEAQCQGRPEQEQALGSRGRLEAEGAG